MIPGNSFDFAPVVENDLYRLCSSHGIELVDTSTAFKKSAAQESALSASGRLSTPFVYRPIKPEYGVYTHDQYLEDGYVKMGLFAAGSVPPISSTSSLDIGEARPGIRRSRPTPMSSRPSTPPAATWRRRCAAPEDTRDRLGCSLTVC